MKHQVRTGGYYGGVGNMDDVLETIGRLKVYSLTSGWSELESGPCCDKCQRKPEHFDGRADALKALCYCTNPFQVAGHCKCHIPTRKAVQTAVNRRLEFIEKLIQAVL